jgi:predicted dehydrogenase
MVRTVIWGGTHIHIGDHQRAIESHPSALLVGQFTDDEMPASEVLQQADAVIVDGRTYRHLAQVRHVRAQNLACFVEKPLADNLHDAGELATILPGAPHATGFFLHHVPAVRHWLTHVPTSGAVVSMAFGHDARLRGAFAGRFAWMIDPLSGGSGSFADLAIHLVHLVRMVWPAAAIEPVEIDLDMAMDGLSDSGGHAVLDVGSNRVSLEVSAERNLGLCAEVRGSGTSWRVDDGALRANGSLVLQGPEPDAATAVTAFLDRLAGQEEVLRPASLTEALDAQAVIESLLNR